MAARPLLSSIPRLESLVSSSKSSDSHHGGTAVVELDSTLGKLGLLIKGVPSKVKGSVTEVTWELRFSGNIFHDEKLKSSNEGNNLEKSSLGDGINSGPSIGNGAEGSSGLVDVSWK